MVLPVGGAGRSETLVSYPEPDFEEVFTTSYDRLVRTLSAMTGDPELAKDCVQDAFVKAATRWKRISGYDNPTGWVLRVAINRSRDLHRSDRRRRKREEQIWSDESRKEQTDQSAAVDSTMSLAEMLNTLPERQRTAASLFYVADMSIAEIGSTLKISEGAVKFHLSKARGALRATMDRESDHRG